MTISAAQHYGLDVPPPSPAPRATQERPAPSAYWLHLAHALQGLFGLYLLVHVAQLGLSVWSARTLGGWADRPRTYDFATATSMDRWTVLSGIADLVFVALIAPCFIVWLFIAHRSPRMYRPALQHRSGWAIGGWFVPILNLWRPLQMVNDVRRGALGHDPARGGLLVGSWWASLFVTSILIRISVGMLPADDEKPRAYLAALAQSAVVDCVMTVASAISVILAIGVVRHVTRLVRSSA